jgi:hypothetical protein
MAIETAKSHARRPEGLAVTSNLQGHPFGRWRSDDCSTGQRKSESVPNGAPHDEQVTGSRSEPSSVTITLVELQKWQLTVTRTVFV